MLKLIAHDFGWACLVFAPVAVVVVLGMLLRGKRESRLLAGWWGLLIGAVIVSPGWYLLALSWGDRHFFSGLGGLLATVLELFNIGTAVVTGTAVALVLNAYLARSAGGKQFHWRWLALPVVLFGALLVTAIMVRWPVIQNERAWSRANASLAQVGLLASECKDGQVTAIQIEFELSQKLIFKRLPVQPEFADRIAAHRQVEYLLIDQLNITDADLQKIAQLPNLKHLAVGSDLVTDQGAAALGGSGQLRHLALKCPGVTDASLPALIKLKDLKYLYLDGVPITDQGLMQLRGMSQAEHITVDSPHLTKEGMDEYRNQNFDRAVSLPWERDPATGNSREKVLPSRKELEQKP